MSDPETTVLLLSSVLQLNIPFPITAKSLPEVPVMVLLSEKLTREKLLSITFVLLPSFVMLFTRLLGLLDRLLRWALPLALVALDELPTPDELDESEELELDELAIGRKLLAVVNFAALTQQRTLLWTKFLCILDSW